MSDTPGTSSVHAPEEADVVVVGSCHNGLVAAAYLAKAARTMIKQSHPEDKGGRLGALRDRLFRERAEPQWPRTDTRADRTTPSRGGNETRTRSRDGAPAMKSANLVSNNG